MAVLEASYIHRAFIRHELMRGCVCGGKGGGAVRLSGSIFVGCAPKPLNPQPISDRIAEIDTLTAADIRNLTEP